MQKVEGSNPFSRFDRKPRSGGAFSFFVAGPLAMSLKSQRISAA